MLLYLRVHYNHFNVSVVCYSYQIPPLVTRKTAVVISPLLSLMQDQACGNIKLVIFILKVLNPSALTGYESKTAGYQGWISWKYSNRQNCSLSCWKWYLWCFVHDSRKSMFTYFKVRFFWLLCTPALLLQFHGVNALFSYM